MVKVMLQLYPVIPAADEDERMRMRPLGRNVERYQETIRGTAELVKACEDLGLWGVATIEHHFHSEGYEVGPAPGILNAYWAAHTERIRIGQLGYVMSAQNPIRVAEETAILDHLLQGRSFVGFARGYQARWTNTLGQHLGTRATHSPDIATQERIEAMGERFSQELTDDQINRRIFEEQIDMVQKAWTMESFDHNTDLWQVPFPYDTGTEWSMHSTAQLGAPGEMPDARHVRRVSVVPAPYTKPHPPVFVASSASPDTAKYCAQKGFIPTYFARSSGVAAQGPNYVRWAKEAGRDVQLGQNQAVVRWLQIGKDEREARDMVARYDAEMQKHFYSQASSTLSRGDTASYTQEDWVDACLESGLWIAGDIEQVKQQYVEQWKALPAEYAVIIAHYAQQPAESVIKNLELFMEHVKPELDALTEYAEEPIAAAF
jgi:alkanesulfonate monooxygenase SsuD/methylene tetrahydromethanopterin reductase-like flavin-dependent oxidoreductase (luciferase family)